MRKIKLHHLSQWSTKTLVAGVAVLAAAAFAAVGPAVAARTNQRPAVAAAPSTGVSLGAFVIEATQQVYLPPGPATIGFVIAVRTRTIDSTGQVLGTAGFSCVVVGTAPDVFSCSGPTALSGGTIIAEGLITRADVETPGSKYDMAVTGGTGQYIGLRGVLHLTQLQPHGQFGRSRAHFESA